MTGHATRIGHDARRSPHQRHPIGRGHVRDEDISVRKPAGVGERADHANRTAGTAGRGAEAADEWLRGRSARGKSGSGSVRSAAGRSDGPRLQHPDLAVGIKRPLGVLRRPVVPFDPDCDLRKLTHFGVIEYRTHRLLCRQLTPGGPTTVGRLDHEFLRTHLARDDRHRLLLDHISVRRDAARDDRLTQPERPLDHDQIGSATRRIDREHHAGTSGCHLALHHNCDVHLGLGEPAAGAIEHGAAAKQRGPAAAYSVDDGVGSGHVQERLVHSGKRGGLRVLRRCRGANSNGDLSFITGQVLVGLADRSVQPRRQWLRQDHLAHPGGHLCQRRGVIHLEFLQEGRNPRSEIPRLAECRVRRRPDHETGRHRQMCPRQLTEVGALTTGKVDVLLTELDEATHRAHRLSRSCGACGHGEPLPIVTTPALCTSRHRH